MKKAIEFLRAIKPRDHVIIVSHNDGDGICSSILMKKFMKKYANIEPEKIISQPMPVEKNLVQRIKSYLPNKLIFLDLAMDQQSSIIMELKKYAKILIIDHHQITKKPAGVVYYNPREKEPNIYRSASYLVYKLCSSLVDMGNFLWFAIVGIVSDYEIKDSMDLIKEAEKKYPEYIKKTDQKSLQKSFFGKISDMINAFKAKRNAKPEKIIKIFESTDQPKDLMYSDSAVDLLNAYKEVENELAAIKKDLEKNSETRGKIIFYKLRSGLNLRSAVSTIISEKHLDKLIVVWQEKEGEIKLSARNQDKAIDAASVLQRAVENGTAGGHKAAAGATLKKEDWPKFKERLIEIVNK